MKTIVTTILLNLGYRKTAASGDVLLQGAKKTDEVDAAVPTCLPSV